MKKDLLILDTEQKALEINLNEKVYGTFSEIGAGQEVARFFFKAGASAGTIAKTMSAYDKTFSDKIYGTEKSGRYVCQSRLHKMLDHEYKLIEDRISDERPDTCFFVFADTVSAINYQRTIKGDGWLGLRFQLSPEAPPNDIIMHVNMHDRDNTLQQQAIGILGVNMIYAAYAYKDDIESMLRIFMDNLVGRISIDMVNIKGPDFAEIDNRLVGLYLVKNNTSPVVIFGEDRDAIHASEFLYKKNLVLVRGAYHPVNLVHVDMAKAAFRNFVADKDEVDEDNTKVLLELTVDHLNKEGEIDERDFLDRVELLNALGYKVMLSNCSGHSRIIGYLSRYKIKHYAIVMGVKKLLELINEKFYSNKEGQLLSSFGDFFSGDVTTYLYPKLQPGTDVIMDRDNIPIPDGIKYLYKHLCMNKEIVNIKHYNPDILHIFSKEIRKKIKADDSAWEQMVPKIAVQLIKDKGMFGYPSSKMEFEY